MFLLYGTDLNQIKNYKDRILKSKINYERNEINLINSSFNDSYNKLWTKSLFQLKRIFIIKRFDLFLKQANSNDFDMLLKLKKNDNEIIFISNSLKLPNSKKFKLFLEFCKLFKCIEPNENDLREIVLDYLDSLDVSISYKALDYLLYVLPNSIDIIKNELNKIINITKNITLNLLEINLINYLKSNVFILTNSILEDNIYEFKKQYFLIDEFFDIKSFLNLLSSNLYAILKILVLKKEHKNVNQFLELHPYRFKVLERISFNFNIRRINIIMNFIIKFNSDYNRLNSIIIFKIFLLNII